MQRWLTQIRDLFRSRNEIYEDASEGRQFDAIYFIMLVLACLIALLGLLLNSPAVIIGAMLISPLMGPILSCGLALTVADWKLGKKAARNVVLSIIETVLIAALATFLSPLKDATPEIMARTNPNLMDLLIAFFSGAAGTLALCSRKGALMILPGVAIATAVMPPLATTGYGVSTGQWAVAAGAFMLFFTNLTAIIISADLIFLLVGFRPMHLVDVRQHTTLVRGRFFIAGAVLIVLSIPLIRTLTHAAQQANLRKQVQAVLAEQVPRASARKLDRVSLELRDNEISVQAAVETPKFIEPQEIKEWEGAIHARVGRPVRLELEQLQLARKDSGEETKAAPNRDYLAGGAIRPTGAGDQHASLAGELENLQSRIQVSLGDLLRPLNAHTVSVQSVATRPDTTVAIEVDASIPQPIRDEEWRLVTAAVSRELHSSLELTGNLTIGDPILLRFHQGSLRLNSSDRRLLAQFLSRWDKESGIVFWLVLGKSANAKISASRVQLLKKRSARMEVTALGGKEPLDGDTMMLSAAQRVIAKADRANSESLPAAVSAKPE